MSFCLELRLSVARGSKHHVYLWAALLLCSGILVSAQHGESKDVVEGETLRLQCRFRSALVSSTTLYFWSRINKSGKDNAAINAAALDPHYSIDFSPQEGKYDLLISRAQYDKDNGDFECWLKEGGSGVVIHNVVYHVTVLIQPGEPRITPASPIARENEPFALTCSSEGGSPDPLIRWYKDGALLQGQLQKGGSRDRPTSSVLTITTKMEDDGAIYRCVVWNRAMKEEMKLETSVSLRVHYFPRITVGPYNPLNVLANDDAHLTCSAVANPPVRIIRWVKDSHLLSTSPNHTIPAVTPEDSGIYSCFAENGVGEPTQANLELSVLYGPRVSLASQQEVSVGAPLSVKCNVASNPLPHLIQWLKEKDPFFRQMGDTLKLESVSVDDSGRYICQASTSLRPSGSNIQTETSGNSSVMIYIRHKPGDADIKPKEPVAIAGQPFVLSCSASPAGWPLPDYVWWKEGQQRKELGRRANYTLISVHVSQEGRYFCQPQNSLGQGSIASVYLIVHEPATIVIPLRPQIIKKDGDKNFSITCRARGKPKPRVRWLQNGQEISEDSGLFKTVTTDNVESNNAYTIQSTLQFIGNGRKDNNLSPGDRGRYTCEFENGFGDVERSEMMLRIEHAPVVRHTYNRVAFDVGETAVLQCKMQAYPSPVFYWSSRGRTVDDYGKHGTNTTDLGEDIYAGILSIRDMREEDYGEYTCRASNQVGDDKKTIIHLVRKSAPERPTQLEAVEINSDRVTLRWHEGFSGGFSNTEFVVTYTNNITGVQNREPCRSQNLCHITGLSAKTPYFFKVSATNHRGHSPYSDEIAVITKVNLKDMPRPTEARYDKDSQQVIFTVEPDSLPLIAKIEAKPVGVDEWKFQSVISVTKSEERVSVQSPPEGFAQVRVKLCLKSNNSWCGDEKLARPSDDSLPHPKKSQSGIATEHVIVIIAVAGAIFLALVILIICCCWRKRSKTLASKKDYEMEATNARPMAVSPPYYPDGVINKGLESAVDDIKPGIYTTNTSGINSGMNGHIHTGSHPSEREQSHCTGMDSQSEPWLKSSDLPPDGSYQPYDASLPNGYFYPEDYQPLTEEMMNIKNREHLHSPYYDVSGLPDPYAMGEDDKTQQISLSFDESLESGYSTPNSRSRRVIREIIV